MERGVWCLLISSDAAIFENAGFSEAHCLARSVRPYARHPKDNKRLSEIRLRALKLQPTRAAESIPYNIVEGSAAPTRKEFARFLGISIKSASETEYQLQLAYDYGLLKEKDWNDLTDRTVIVRKRLFRLKKKVDPDDPDEPG